MKINIRAEFDQAIQQMEWGEVLDTLQSAIEDELGVSLDTPPWTPPSPALPTVLRHGIQPHPVGDVHEAHSGCSYHNMGIAPHSFMQPVMAAPTIIQTGFLYCQAGLHSQGQHTFYESPVNTHPVSSTSAYFCEAPPHSNNKAPAISCFGSEGQSLVTPQLLNRGMVYATPYAYTVIQPDSVAPPAPTSMLKKRQYNKPREDRPYVKKPLNAFMLFMKEQREIVVAEIKNRNNAVVNRILGQRWASLSNEERHRFYQKAEEEKMLHSMLNPGWSSSDNYGTKRKRQRRKVLAATESSPSTGVDVKQHTENTAVMEASTSLMMPHTQDTDAVQLPADSLSFLELLHSP